jgi:transposase InsO family protein
VAWPWSAGPPVTAWREALRVVWRVLKGQRKRCGLGTVMAALTRAGVKLAVRLARRAVQVWKKQRARREERHRAAVRVRVRVLQRDAVWSQDALHLHGAGESATWGRLVMDRCTREHPSVALSGPPNSMDSVALLERIRLEQGRVPLPLMADNGAENRGELEAWAREHQVVLLYNLPRTPQHNGAAERSIGELREELEDDGAVQAPAAWPPP